jgi:hypothetical protein
MITASGIVTDRVVGLELGTDDYVVKPFAIGEGEDNSLGRIGQWFGVISMLPR